METGIRAVSELSPALKQVDICRINMPGTLLSVMNLYVV